MSGYLDDDIKDKINDLAMRMYSKGYADGRNTLTKELEDLIDRGRRCQYI